MKRLFTLFAGMLLIGSSASAQVKWTNVIENSSMEEAVDPEGFSSFWCHEFREGEETQFAGFATIVEDPTTPGNHCARVIVRSQEQAEAAGNMIADGDHIAGWDSQFFIYCKDALPVGKMVKLTMKVRADYVAENGEPSCGTQAHNMPGTYHHWACAGNPKFPATWTEYTNEFTVSADMVQNSDGTEVETGGGLDNDMLKEFHTIAFNLADYRLGYTVYFDDIKVYVKDAEDPAEFEGWFNFLRNGTESNDVQRLNNKYTTFTARNGIDGIDRPAAIIADPVDGKPAMSVKTVYYEGVNKTPKVDEEGNPVLDEEGNPTYDEEKYWTKRLYNDAGEARDTVMTSEITDWQTQFFVSIPHKFKQGEKVKVTYYARADKPTTLDTQAHEHPGGYKHWAFVGSPELTEEWQPFEKEVEIGAEQKDCWTIAFNCNKGKDEANTIYFRFDEFSINSAEVKEEDCVLGSEDIIWLLPEKGAEDPSVVSLDMTKALEKLGVARPSILMEGIIKAAVDNEGTLVWEEIQPDYYIDVNGNYAEDGINIAYDEDLTEGNVVGFNIYNDKTDVNGTISTKLLFKSYEDANPADGYARRGWNYLYNISLMTKEAYEQAMGVTAVKSQKANTAIYDLLGRRVAKATKGLYITDGKKILVK